jgi:hypothetical protein
MITLIKWIAGLALTVFIIDFIQSGNKKEFICDIIGHKWVTNDGSTYCERCLEAKK